MCTIDYTQQEARRTTSLATSGTDLPIYIGVVGVCPSECVLPLTVRLHDNKPAARERIKASERGASFT